jgi:hypothetical protein
MLLVQQGRKPCAQPQIDGLPTVALNSWQFVCHRGFWLFSVGFGGRLEGDAGIHVTITGSCK